MKITIHKFLNFNEDEKLDCEKNLSLILGANESGKTKLLNFINDVLNANNELFKFDIYSDSSITIALDDLIIDWDRNNSNFKLKVTLNKSLIKKWEEILLNNFKNWFDIISHKITEVIVEDYSEIESEEQREKMVEKKFIKPLKNEIINYLCSKKEGYYDFGKSNKWNLNIFSNEINEIFERHFNGVNTIVEGIDAFIKSTDYLFHGIIVENMPYCGMLAQNRYFTKITYDDILENNLDDIQKDLLEKAKINQDDILKIIKLNYDDRDNLIKEIGNKLQNVSNDFFKFYNSIFKLSDNFLIELFTLTTENNNYVINIKDNKIWNSQKDNIKSYKSDGFLEFISIFLLLEKYKYQAELLKKQHWFCWMNQEIIYILKIESYF